MLELVMKKIFIIAISAVISLTAYSQNLTILHTNDTHSHIDPVKGGAMNGHAGVLERAAYIDSVRSAVGRKNLLVVDAGDFSQGTSYFTLLGGDLEIKVMNAMGYDITCLGNHEFDNGMDELARRIKMADFKVVCANYNFKGSPLEKLVKPYTIVRRGGMKIGVIGARTDVTEVVDKDIAERMTYSEPSGVVNRYARILRDKKKCDLIICLTHIGYEVDVRLASTLKNVDLIIGGHSHTDLPAATVVKDAEGKEINVVTSQCWGFYVGNMNITK